MREKHKNGQAGKKGNAGKPGGRGWLKGAENGYYSGRTKEEGGIEKRGPTRGGKKILKRRRE